MITTTRLKQLAWEYIKECDNNMKDHPTSSGKIAQIKHRHIPTISYFLKVWIPCRGEDTISRSTYYNWINQDQDQLKLDTIKEIEGLFEALAVDIVANEGRGVFYAKNKLGMRDNPQDSLTIQRINLPEWFQEI